jgi:hypothetical protein
MKADILNLLHPTSIQTFPWVPSFSNHYKCISFPQSKTLWGHKNSLTHFPIPTPRTSDIFKGYADHSVRTTAQGAPQPSRDKETRRLRSEDK